VRATEWGMTLFVLATLLSLATGGEPLRVAAEKKQLVISRGTQPVAKYVFADEQIRRPYFMALHTPTGVEVTRHHPPREGTDATDHATIHPGAWLAFGELGGADFWRNKGRVQHAEFSTEAQVEEGVVRFGVVNRYLDQQRLVCQEKAAYTLRVLDAGYLLTWDSAFSSTQSFVFGDQEEMGLGIRLATPLCVKEGSGAITSSEGKRNEEQVWGTQAAWCDYSGAIDERRVGMLLIPHPENFRPCWFHARDYGLLVANPFGQKAFTKGQPSRVEVKPGQTLRLRFGLWIYASQEKPDFRTIVTEYERSHR